MPTTDTIIHPETRAAMQEWEGRWQEGEEAVSAAPAGQTDAFIPDSEESVDWVLGKVADARSRAARLRENMEKMAREADREAEFFEWKYGAALQVWARAQLGEGRRRSVRLPNGVVGFRTKPAGVSVTDEARALAWAGENLPEAVVQRLDKKALADALLQTGEIIDGVVFTEAEETFYVK